MRGSILSASAALAGCQLLYAGDCGPPALVSDAAPIDDVVADAAPSDSEPPIKLCNIEAPFDSLTPLETLNTLGHETAAVLTQDELSVFYVYGTEIFTASRSNIAEPFGAARRVPELHDPDSTTSGLALSFDGLTLFISRLRFISGMPARQIWVAQRPWASAPFGPLSLVEGASTEQWEFGLSIGPMSRDLYITTQPPVFSIEMNILVSEYRMGMYKPPRRFFKVNDPTVSEHSPVISFDERTLYFARRFYPDGSSPEGGGNPPNVRTAEIYVSTRTDVFSPFGEPTRIVELSDPRRGEQPNWLSRDQCRLYLQVISEQEGSAWDLYVATRHP